MSRMTSGSAFSSRRSLSSAAVPSPACELTIRANLPTFLRSLATIRSAVASPIPGNVASSLTSWSWIVRASSRTGRTIARSALRTPTPSTEQKMSKNSRSIGERKPTRRGTSRLTIAPPSM